jgi:hypothetical protein
MTGHYIAQFSNGVYRLQLDETADQHLTGQLDTVVIGQNGKLEYTSFAATGVADGNSVSLSFKQSGILGAELSGSGATDGNKLSLTGNLNPRYVSTINFIRASDAQYQSTVNNLIAAVNKAASAKAAADAQKALAAKQIAFAKAGASLAADLLKFESAADQHLARWPHTEQIYQQITAKMSDYLSIERQLAGNDNAAAKRGQIVVAINQVSITTDQLHIGVQSLQNNFETNISPLLGAIQKAKFDCETHNVITATSNGAAACQDIVRASEPFQAKYNAFAAGLVQLEQVYQAEHGKQDRLMQEANRLE